MSTNYFKLDAQLNVTEIADDRKIIDFEGKDPSVWARQPEGGIRNKSYTNGVIGAGWLVSYDSPDFEFVTRLAASASKLDGQDWIPVDKGPSVSPRYDVMVCPKVGDDVSKSFNGDYYPVGKVVSVSAAPVRRVITVDEGQRGKLRFYRRGLSAGWVQAGGTWGLVKGIHNAWNREF